MGLRLAVSSPTENYTHTASEPFVRIGRSNKCEFVIPKDDLSREHCLLEVINGEHFITDVGSKNGICVDRVRIPVNTKIKVTEQSYIVMANIYQLKINALDVKTKADIVAPKKQSNELETITFQLDLPQDISRKKRPVKRPLPTQVTEAKSSLFSGESVKMFTAFIVILGFVIYQALGL